MEFHQASAVRADPYPMFGFRFKIGQVVRLAATKPYQGEPAFMILSRSLTEVEDGHLLREYRLRMLSQYQYHLPVSQSPYELTERELAEWVGPAAEDELKAAG